MAVTLQFERWADCWRDLLPIWQGPHARETVAPQDWRLQVNPNVEGIQNLEDAGALVLCTLREDGRLIGYCLALVLPDFSCQQVLMGNIMLYYIAPPFRGQGWWTRMLTLMEDDLYLRGAACSFLGTKAHMTTGPQMAHAGYHPYGMQWIKWFEKDT